MTLKEFFKTRRGRQQEMADFLGVSRSVMSQMVNGVCAISDKRCWAIEQFTCGSVSRKDLRPNDWQERWPELAQQIQNDSKEVA